MKFHVDLTYTLSRAFAPVPLEKEGLSRLDTPGVEPAHGPGGEPLCCKETETIPFIMHSVQRGGKIVMEICTDLLGISPKENCTLNVSEMKDMLA
eukprot:8216259-Pyramimonas_sp.AAC.1